MGTLHECGLNYVWPIWGVNTGPNYHCSRHHLKYILIRVSMQLIISGCRGVLSGKLSDAIVQPQFQLKIIIILCQKHAPSKWVILYSYIIMELGKRKVTFIVCERCMYDLQLWGACKLILTACLYYYDEKTSTTST